VWQVRLIEEWFDPGHRNRLCAKCNSSPHPVSSARSLSVPLTERSRFCRLSLLLLLPRLRPLREEVQKAEEECEERMRKEEERKKKEELKNEKRKEE